MGFGIQRTDRRRFQVLSVQGYMGNRECGQLEAELVRLAGEKRRRVIVNMKEVTFITTASLVRLAVAARPFQQMGGEFKLAGLSPSASALVKLAKLESELGVQPGRTT